MLSGIEAKRVKALRAPADLRLCHVSFADGVLHKVRAGSNVKEPRQVILDDLNDCCGLKWSATGNATKDDTLELLLFSAQYFFKARVDPLSHSYLHIHNATPLPPSWLEVQREGAWSPVVRWTELQGSLPPPTGHDTIDWLLRGLAEYEATLSESRRLSRSDALFRNWLNILAAKTDIEQGRQAPISYDGVKALGSSRLELSLAVPPEAEIVGQPRMVELAAFETISGEVESIGVDTLIFFVNEGAVGDFPRRGKLLFDTRAERRAIQLQRQAVDAVRFRRAVRTDLGDLLVSPGEIKPPGDAGDVTFIDGQLDASKQLAVRKALAAESFLVVEGPPGTGKTRFIAELVLQTLKREPAARILLTSQTHVALDHALQKLRDTRPELRLVRIGRRGDDKISAEVSELLLENKVDAWLLDVRKRSQLFVKAYAKRIGADEDEVRLGMAVARLRNALDRISRLERERQTTLAVVQELRSEQAARAEVDTDERFNEVNQSLRDSVTTARTLELELTRAGVEVAEARSALKLVPGLGAEISDLTAMELAEWEDAFLRGNDATRRLHRILMLAEEWYLRFGRSRDFFGALISESQVIAGTCLGFAGVRGMQHLHFDLCIVDEASKATVTELLVPISRSRRWVLVGDRQQLPPFVESAIDDPAIREAHGVTKSDLETTLLTTLAESLPPECVTRLVQQHRMVHQIGDLISHCFYEGSLLSVRKGEADALAPALPRPVTWFSTSHESDRNERKDGSSYKNVAEARTVAWLLKQLNFLARLKRRRLSIAVLTGYGAQRRELQRGIDALYSSLDYVTVECNTVDAFQGREANIAIYSVTRSNEQDDVGFLRERRRINVALSRAQDGLAIVGDAHFIRNAGGLNPLGRVLTYMEAHQLDCFVQEAAA